MAQKPYFLRYQQEWIDNTSRLKICKKSRRIGFTFAEAYVCVRYAAQSREEGGGDVWFSSADKSAAAEFIVYCQMWARVLNAAASDLGEIVLDVDKDVRAFAVSFGSGFRVNALSSNPSQFRSKGGKVVLDEFAFHEDPEGMWRAAAPAILWGYPMSVFSSSAGTGTTFYERCEAAKAPGSKWSYHEVTLLDAIDDGLVEKIRKLERPATQAEIDEFVAECREIAGDEETFEQEFMCVDLDSSSYFIENNLILGCESDLCPQPVVINGKDLERVDSDLYAADEWAFEFDSNAKYLLGVDIGRSRDLTVMWLLEYVGDTYWTRFVLVLEKMQFRKQFKHLARFFPHVRRACIDRNGLGMQMAEDAKEDFGEYRVEPTDLTNASKAAMATTLKPEFEDVRLRLPRNPVVRSEIRKIKKSQLPGGATRYDGERGKNGHSDYFWALALARYADDRIDYVPYESERIGRRA